MLTDNMKGALIMALSMALFTLNDTFLKLLAGDVPLYQILTLRNGAVTLVFLVLAWRSGAFRRGLNRRDLRLSLLRGVAEVATAYFFLNALFNMPLANVTAVLQSAPLSVMLAAALVLREPIGWRRISAALIGFCGVLMIVRPGPDGFNIYALYTLIAVACLTVRDIATRKLSKEAPTLLVCDASFIALEKLLAVPLSLADRAAEFVGLFKPQFQVGREHVGKGGLVTDTEASDRAAEAFASWMAGQGWPIRAWTDSPITGGDGNAERLFHAVRA